MAKNFTLIFIAMVMLLLPDLALADGVLDTLTSSVNKQITDTGKGVASILQTMSEIFGVIWIIVMLLMAFFNIEGLKNHAKLLFGALIIIGAVYGLSTYAMS